MIITELSISDSMKSGFQIWKKYFQKIIVVGLIVYIPTQICIELISTLLDNTLSLDENPERLRLVTNIYNLIRYLIGSVALLSILSFIINKLENENEEELTTKEILLTGLNKWPTFIGVGFIAGLKILGYTILLIIPGIYKSVRLSFIDCIVATNNNNFKDECDESEELVKDNWWNVFGFLLLMFLLQFLLEILFAIPLFYFSDSQIISISLGVIVSLLETYFIVVRASYFFKIKQLKTEYIRAIESIPENGKIKTPTV